MEANEYKKIYDWFEAHTLARFLFARVYAYSTLPVKLAYVFLVMINVYTAMFNMAFADTMLEAFRMLIIVVGVPAGVFLLGTLVRAVMNVPRPYEQDGFTPVIVKYTEGKSFPSRHVLSASVIAVVWWPFSPSITVLLLLWAVFVAAVRVVAGVHSIRDVVAGYLFGSVLGGVATAILFAVL